MRKMTSQAAEAFGFADHGLVAEGLRANLVVFDPARVADRATFEDPMQFPPECATCSWAARPVVRDGEMTGRRAGTVVS